MLHAPCGEQCLLFMNEVCPQHPRYIHVGALHGGLAGIEAIEVLRKEALDVQQTMEHMTKYGVVCLVHALLEDVRDNGSEGGGIADAAEVDDGGV